MLIILLGLQAIVVSTAIGGDNPEVVAAREQGLKIFHRADIVAALMDDRVKALQLQVPMEKPPLRR